MLHQYKAEQKPAQHMQQDSEKTQKPHSWRSQAHDKLQNVVIVHQQ